MKTKNVPIKPTIRFGWETAKKNLIFFLKITAIYLLVSFFGNAFQSFWHNPPTFILGVILITTIVIGQVLKLGMIKIVLNFADSKPSEISTLFSISKIRMLVKYFVADMIYGISCGLGFILLVVPGVYIAIRFQYFRYLIVDKDMGIMDSFNESSRLTEGVKWGLFKFELGLLLINLLGFLTLLVGLILTVPTAMVADATMFRRLQKLQK